MLGVPRELIEHKLPLDPKAKPVKRRLCHFAQDKKDVIKKEIARLLDASFIKEVYHPDWLAIPFLYPRRIKIGGYVLIILILIMYAKKDPFKLPRIDQVVDSTAGCSLRNFLNCYSGYHQIPLKEEDQIKTTFITLFGAFCYTIVPFGLKGVGATCSRGIQRCLHSQLGRNTEAYVDDVVVKTREDEGLISDLADTFDNLRKFKMKLNPDKCTFDVPSRKLLGYMVSHVVLTLTQRRCLLSPK
jgi:mRNA-degrading endonuclease RelE of RelBE toxin-antitoxin system